MLRQFLARWKAALVGLAVIGISLILVRRGGEYSCKALVPGQEEEEREQVSLKWSATIAISSIIAQ